MEREKRRAHSLSALVMSLSGSEELAMAATAARLRRLRRCAAQMRTSCVCWFEQLSSAAAVRWTDENEDLAPR